MNIPDMIYVFNRRRRTLAWSTHFPTQSLPVLL